MEYDVEAQIVVIALCFFALNVSKYAKVKNDSKGTKKDNKIELSYCVYSTCHTQYNQQGYQHWYKRCKCGTKRRGHKGESFQAEALWPLNVKMIYRSCFCTVLVLLRRLDLRTLKLLELCTLCMPYVVCPK